jgi:hypothetical protein
MSSKIFNAVMITAISAVAFTSCKKYQEPPANEITDQANFGSIKPIEGIPDSLKVPEGNRLMDDGFARLSNLPG